LRISESNTTANIQSLNEAQLRFNPVLNEARVARL